MTIGVLVIPTSEYANEAPVLSYISIYLIYIDEKRRLSGISPVIAY